MQLVLNLMMTALTSR